MNKIPEATIHLCLDQERHLRRCGLITPGSPDYGPDPHEGAANLAERAWDYLAKGVLGDLLHKPLTPEQMVEVVNVIRAEISKPDWPWRETLVFDVTSSEEI